MAGWLTILAEADGEILGFAALRDDPKVKENRIIEMLYVSPDHAGQGVGKALLDVMELLARQRGAETTTTDASETAANSSRASATRCRPGTRDARRRMAGEYHDEKAPAGAAESGCVR